MASIQSGKPSISIQPSEWLPVNVGALQKASIDPNHFVQEIDINLIALFEREGLYTKSNSVDTKITQLFSGLLKGPEHADHLLRIQYLSALQGWIESMTDRVHTDSETEHILFDLENIIADEKTISSRWLSMGNQRSEL